MDKGVLRQYLAAFVASLSVLMDGTSYGWVTPLLVRLEAPGSELPLTSDQGSWVVALIELGDLFTPLPAAKLVDRWGRKPLLLGTAPVYLLSWVLVLTTRSVSALYTARILQGCAMGVVYTILPMYLAEIAQPEIRGAIGTFFEGMWSLGILLEYCLGPYVSYQHLALVSMVIPAVFLFTFPFMPESPYFLTMVKRHDEAIKSLCWLRCNDGPEDELAAIEESVREEMKTEGSWRELFATPVDRRAFLIVQVATATKSMSGIGAVLSYSSQTFDEASSSFLNPDQFTILMGVLILVSTLAATCTVDRIGRRPLLLLSALGCAVFDLLAAVYYYLDAKTFVDTTAYSWVAFASITAYCVVFSLGVSPLVPLLQAELFPSNTRAFASGISTLTDTMASLISMKLYGVISASYGTYINYLVFSASSLMGAALLWRLLPETKGLSFAQIQAKLAHAVAETSSRNEGPQLDAD